MSFKALILLSSVTDCSETPSIRVEVSFPPMSTGATTISIKSNSFSRKNRLLTVPPDCTVSLSQSNSFFRRSRALCKSNSFWKMMCKFSSWSENAGCFGLDVIRTNVLDFAQYYRTPCFVRCVLSKRTNDTGDLAGISFSLQPIFCWTGPVWNDHKSVVCSIS